VPGLWHLDVANALLVAERRGVITPSDSDLFWARLNSLPIDTDRDAIQERQSRMKTLARANGLFSPDRRLDQAATCLGLPLNA